MKSQQTLWLGLILIILVIIAAIAIKFNYKDDSVSQDLGGIPNSELCFANDNTMIQAKLYSNQTTSGRFDYFPISKDTIVGTFSGTWKASATSTALEIAHSYIYEGKGVKFGGKITATTTRTIVINDTYALIDWDGEKGPDSLSDQQIQKVACDSIVWR